MRIYFATYLRFEVKRTVIDLCSLRKRHYFCNRSTTPQGKGASESLLTVFPWNCYVNSLDEKRDVWVHIGTRFRPIKFVVASGSTHARPADQSEITES